MKFEIKNRFSGSVIFSAECASFKFCVELAIRAKVSLLYADLSYADLRSADLRSADLRYADLRSADLSYADLRSADLRYADLSYADLRYADLRCADLSYADLRYADLRSADLSYADLSYADLSYADLRSAGLRSADLSYADLRYADLIVFKHQKHWAYYTFDGSLRIGCIVLPITEWKETFDQIGLEEGYTKEQILMYGQFINMCYEKFLRDTEN